MGLLDSLLSGSQGGYGGLLDSLMYPSPLTQKDNYATNEFDSQFLPQRPDPFGPVPNYGAPRDFSPPSAFNGAAPAAPIQFAGAAPEPQAPALPPAQNVAPAPQPAPPQNMANVGGYQMPQIGNPNDFKPQPQMAQAGQSATTDISAQSRQPQPPMDLPPALGGGSVLSRLGNPDGLIARLTGNDTRSVAQQNLRAQFGAIQQQLISNGDSPQQAASKAMIAVMNPDAAKTILPELFTNKTELKMVKDAFGAEHPYSWNSREQTLKPVGAEGEMSGGGNPGQSPSLLAPGVQQYNPSLSGDQYLAQFGPELQAAVKAYIKGDVMPSGNPRLQAIQTKAKEIAQKYGQDMGIPVSDAVYSEKRKYYTELGTNSPNSAGGQAKAFNQGISHMTALADNLEKLDNSNGMGIPAIAQGVNAVRQGFSTQQSAISDEAKSLGQTVAGEVGKLFSGSAGGGVHERELTRERFDTVKSKPQLAAALRATLETMDGGLKALEQRRDSVLGPNSGVDLVSNDTRQNIAKIQGVIDRLEGKSSAAPGGLPSGWSVKVR